MTANRKVRRSRNLPKTKSIVPDRPRQEILQSILTEAAATLLPLGITPLEFSEAAKQAFCKCAATLSRFENGRVNKSRVAVLTGLRRGEVRRLLSVGERGLTASRPASPVEAVIQGWHTNKLFTTKRGEPKKLTLTGGKDSFSRLVQLYANDLPHHAVLKELLRLGLVFRVDRRLEVQNLSALKKLQNTKALAHLMPAIVDSFRVAELRMARYQDLPMRRLVLHANNLVELATVRDKCMASVESMLVGLEDSLSPESATRIRKERSGHSCAVTVLLVENKKNR